MVGISTVVTMLLAVLLIQGQSLQKRIRRTSREKRSWLSRQSRNVPGDRRLEEYMQSDEYIEKIAREKIGLVKDNEIIFKEVK